MKHGKIFFQTYCSGDFTGKVIVDVGAQDVNGSLRTYSPKNATYIGVDFAEGSGVDIVIDNPYSLPFEDESVDVIVCSSVFEHSDFFWQLYLECLRILKPNGLLYVNAPSNGMVHRYPVDSWRFYPDSGVSLVKWAHHNTYKALLLESFVGEKSGPITGEGMWNDFVAVFLKDGAFSSSHPQRIQDITGPLPHSRSFGEISDTPQLANVSDHDFIKNKENTITFLKQTIEAQDQEIAHQASSIESKSNTIKMFEDSTSWRLTKPLRFAKEKITERSSRSKTILVKSLRIVWQRIPIAQHKKNALKRLMVQTPTPTNPTVSTSSIPTVKFDFTKECFTDYKTNPVIDPVVKLIAFYLPQFHPFPENDCWWGKGFTEWYNVGRAKQNYQGHYQPHCPIHNGYYDLRVPAVMEDQARLAKEYGVHGFSYYFYWFAGKILMETPLEMMLQNPKVDIPFCLTWANENWTRRWDGLDSDVLIAQDHSEEDSIAFIQHLFKYFDDPRYIRIDGKPLLIIYRANIIPDIIKTTKLWRIEAKKQGYSDLYLICAQSFDILDPEQLGFDAAVEFPPHSTGSADISHTLHLTNPDFSGQIFSYDQVVSSSALKPEPDYKLLRTAMLSWDNTARKQNNSHIFHGFSLMRYKQWLSTLCGNVSRSDKYSPQEKLVFVNAWNEWAEGTHLEPDRRYGYGYLQATYDVVSCYDKNHGLDDISQNFIKYNDIAVIVHLHFNEAWSDIKSRLKNFRSLGFDLFVTATNIEAVKMVLTDFPLAHVEFHENRGRDIFPFTKTIDLINKNNYSAACKLHTKRSIHRIDGDEIRNQLLDSLIGCEKKTKDIVERLASNRTLGIVVPGDFLILHDHQNMACNRETVLNACEILDMNFKYDVFPAGSMFWFKPEALRDMKKFKPSDFDAEHGFADGTLPHGIERIFCLLAAKSGYTTETC
jgi:lipopolysaccharide biosynthesis protein/SAM-dependent methyltransferase